jgi:hypothetical protein
MAKERKANGWNTLWPWVILAFVVVISAWVWLISTASKNAPEPIPLEGKSIDG